MFLTELIADPLRRSYRGRWRGSTQLRRSSPCHLYRMLRTSCRPPHRRAAAPVPTAATPLSYLLSTLVSAASAVLNSAVSAVLDPALLPPLGARVSCVHRVQPRAPASSRRSRWPRSLCLTWQQRQRQHPDRIRPSRNAPPPSSIWIEHLLCPMTTTNGGTPRVTNARAEGEGMDDNCQAGEHAPLQRLLPCDLAGALESGCARCRRRHNVEHPVAIELGIMDGSNCFAPMRTYTLSSRAGRISLVTKRCIVGSTQSGSGLLMSTWRL